MQNETTIAVTTRTADADEFRRRLERAMNDVRRAQAAMPYSASVAAPRPFVVPHTAGEWEDRVIDAFFEPLTEYLVAFGKALSRVADENQRVRDERDQLRRDVDTIKRIFGTQAQS